MLLLIVILLFLILLAVLPKEDAAGVVKALIGGFTVFVLGTVLFYAFGFYLYESHKVEVERTISEYPAKRTAHPCTAKSDDPWDIAAASYKRPECEDHVTVQTPEAKQQAPKQPAPLPECSDPYEPFQREVPTCEWHEEKH